MTGTEFLAWNRMRNIQNLCDAFLLAHKSDKNKLFCSNGDFALTYDQALSAIQGFASQYGANIKGKDVGLFMSNGSALLITYLSVLWCGGTPALLNAAMPTVAGKNLLNNLSPEMIFSDRPLDFSENSVAVDDDLISAWIALKADNVSACGTGEMPATYFFSGGTTGVPKRILYSHDKILAAGERMQWGWPMRDGEVFLPVAPFSHIYGFLMGVCVPLQCGGTSIIPKRFSPVEVMDLIEDKKVTVLGGGPPSIYLGLLSDPSLPNRDLSALRVCPGGGAPFPLDVHNRWKDATGLTIYEGYGMTEIAPICVNKVGDGLRLGSVGRIVPDSEISIVDLNTGTQVLPNGEAGEIRVRGPHGMNEYCDNPEETAIVLRDGWIHTGDIGVLDNDGFLTITDRKKDVIIHKGFNVFPREVEEALISHASISNVCVVGKEDARNGENIVAFVTSTGGQTPTEEELLAHCRQYLVAYRLPTQVVFSDTLELTPAGKIDRLALHRRAQKLGTL